jgi:hypothetical protein
VEVLFRSEEGIYHGGKQSYLYRHDHCHAKRPARKEVQAIVERWRKHMDYFWTPTLDQLLALANGYNDDPRFKANFDKLETK